MDPRFFRKFLHPVCLVGTIVFVVGLLASVFSLAVDLVEEHPRAYQGLLTFVLYPTVMFGGLVIVIAGLWLERRRARRLREEHVEWRPAIDVRNKKHRRILYGLAGFALLFATASMLGAFRAYEYTESEAFCGSLCHAPMGPQGIAHVASPHASVPCVECHVAPGVGGYVSAKLSGTRQLMQTLLGKFHTPIRAPRDRVPDALQTCEHCHWKDQYWGERLEDRVRYGYDLRNSKRSLKILANLGGGGTPYRPGQGIHWHMSIRNRVFYRAADEHLQEIPWVRVERADGTAVVYRNSESELAPEEIAGLKERRFNCLDCHNRPAHRFLTPEKAIDSALESGLIDTSLPFIKKAGVAALAVRAETKAEGRAACRRVIEDFYRDQFEGAVLERKKSVEEAIRVVQEIYDRNNFPEAGIDGYTHPDNIGHRDYPGCFRCHGGKHTSEDGEVLPSDCSLCHRFFETQPGSVNLIEIPVDASTLHPFVHPDHYSQVACWTCHSGKASPYGDCVSCHEHAGESHGMQFECSICHKPGHVKPENNTCIPCHPTGESEMHSHPDHGDCLGCHKPHTWALEDPDASCSTGSCHEVVEEKPLAEHYPGKHCGPCHEFTGVKTHMMGLPIGPNGVHSGVEVGGGNGE